MAANQAPVVDRIRIIPRPDDFLDRNVGSSGEVFFDKQANTLRVYNGKLAGGYTLLTSGNLSQQLADAGVALLERTVTVGVDTANGQATGVFYIDGVEKPQLNLVRGYTYLFDQSDETNNSYANLWHPLMFATTPDGDLVEGGAHYNPGIVYLLDDDPVSMRYYTDNFQRATTRKVIFTVKSSAPSNLYYWCHFHTGQGNLITVADPGTGSGSDESSLEVSDIIKVSDSAPTTPTAGNIWLNSNTGALYVYVTDVDGSQWIQPVVGIGTGGGSGDSNQNAFSNFAVAGQTTVTAASITDTVNFVAGSGMTITTSGDTITFVSSGGGGGGGGIALTDLSVTAEGTPSGDGGLSYNNGTGAFTFTPPDLTSYITASSSTELTNKTGNISQWTNDSNYITTYTETDTLDSVTDRGATTSNNVTVGDITANAYINAGTGSPTFSSASSITLTAPDGVISNGVFSPMYTGLIKGSSGTVTVNGQGVSTTSVTDNGLGDYTLTFSSPLAADTDSFGLLGSVQNQSVSATVSFVKTSTTVIQIYVHEASGNNIDADVFLTIYEI